MIRLVPLLLALLVAACASNRFEANVTRFHLGAAPSATTVAVRALDPAEEQTLAFRAQADAVLKELAAAGFRPAPAETAEVLAYVKVESQVSERRRRSPISVGIGGATGGNVSVGGGVSFPVGGGTSQIRDSEMQLVLRRRADGQVLWEGRARATQSGPDAGSAAALLARALLSGYPGQSGRTVRWVAK
ncbi:MAG: DUF4136 domain-containing protein [Thermaurantiacus tibetensis]|uniref:DUF4136 domain-containing protein n=1 Tax=Thermaurantiacus tibetensis TaxID=2759035 RepID=UPI00189072ED|nr:DUF4136 domain-containing protein [Thermaurantiacus tibetensis]